MRHAFWLVGLISLTSCVKASEEASPAASAQDAGSSQDAGSVIAIQDAGPGPDIANCTPDAGAPNAAAGGIRTRPEMLPTALPPQGSTWTKVAADPDCDSVVPTGVVPELTWSAPSPTCAAAVVDSRGNLTIDWADTATILNSFFTADGQGAGTVMNGVVRSQDMENQLWAAPSATEGFALLSRGLNPWCSFVRNVSADGRPGTAVLVDPTRAEVQQIVRNPKGGFVLARKTAIGTEQPFTQTFDVRFIDDAFAPLGDWHTVTVFHKAGEDPYPAENITWSITVDGMGNALVLTFAFPPSFGPPAAPSTWKFSARWMSAAGPLTDEFQPVSPIVAPASTDGFTLFAGWGSLVPLIGGGFAAFREVVPASIGTVSPSGWYALYLPSVPGVSAPPGWLQAYDGSLQQLASGNGYAARTLDHTTCARTISLIAPSGKACYALTVENTSICSLFPDTLWPDGTLIIQDANSTTKTCTVRWWPRLANTQL